VARHKSECRPGFAGIRSHYLSVVQRKPGALRNGAPFADLPQGFKRLQAILLERPIARSWICSP
jgi:hypothetical protein